MQARGRFAFWSLTLPDHKPSTVGHYTIYPLKVAGESAIRDALKDFQFEQSCLLNSYTQIFPSMLVSFFIRTSGEFNDSDLHACWAETVLQYARFRLEEDDFWTQSGILVHEATHMGFDSNDENKFEDMSKRERMDAATNEANTNRKSAQKRADNYAFFAESVSGK